MRIQYFRLIIDRRDSSGIRFYLGKELRQYDRGYLTLGTDSNGAALAIPLGADRFSVDSYCTARATKVCKNLCTM